MTRIIGEVSRLTWVERDHGWRAGLYEIELVAPHLWVCSRRRRDGTVLVEFTGGSLSAMKDRVEAMSRRRAATRRMISYLGVFVGCVAGAAFFAESGSSVGAFLVVGLSVIAIFSAIRAVDCVVVRSWESLPATYQ